MEPVNKKCYTKHVLSKVFKELHKSMKESISSNITDLFHLSGSWRTLLGHLGTQGTRTFKHLRHSGTCRALSHSGTQGILAFRHLGTRALKHLSGNWTLRHSRHSGTYSLETLETLYLADSVNSYTSIAVMWKFVCMFTIY